MSRFPLRPGIVVHGDRTTPATCVAEERNTMKSLKAAAVLAGSLIVAGVAAPAYADTRAFLLE